MSGTDLIKALLEEMIDEQGTDLYLSVGTPPCLRIGDRILPMRNQNMTNTMISEIIRELLPEEKLALYQKSLELNYSFQWDQRARFRANFYYQQQTSGIVIRRINTKIPTADDLHLPQPYREAVLHHSGLVLLIGRAGSGKSTSLAAMIDYRNRNGYGHIITIEDPIEYIHTPQQCLFTQRDVGIDTHSFADAVKNTLRQRPDVVLIGEIRDLEVMEQAIAVAESGHLCLATLHANNTSQAIERIVDMFPEERHSLVFKSLSQLLRGIFAQRLVDDTSGDKTMANEILLNQGAITSLIEEGKIKELKAIIEKSNSMGMHSFDQCLYNLHISGKITKDIALVYADSDSDLRLKIRQWEGGAGRQEHGMPSGADTGTRPANTVNQTAIHKNKNDSTEGGGAKPGSIFSV